MEVKNPCWQVKRGREGCRKWCARELGMRLEERREGCRSVVSLPTSLALVIFTFIENSCWSWGWYKAMSGDKEIEKGRAVRANGNEAERKVRQRGGWAATKLGMKLGSRVWRSGSGEI